MRTAKVLVKQTGDRPVQVGSHFHFFEVNQALRFDRDAGRLLVDEGQTAFRAYGCFDQVPRHGLFVIDKSGMIRSRYIGDAPFAAAPQVRTRIGQLLTAERNSVRPLPKLDFRFLLDNLR